MIDLSIIIINWNTKDVLNDCLRSVYDNLHTLPAEVFVVDNASTDGSQAMVKSLFPSVRLIENTENKGFAPANNQALRLASGRYLLLLNSDTLILNDVLQKSVQYLDQNPAVGVMGCRVLNEDRSLQLTCLRFPSLLNLLLSTSGLSHLRRPAFFGREHLTNWDRTDERPVDVVSGCYMLVRAQAMAQVGLLDESFFFCGEETDWCKRFHAANWQLRFAPVGEIVHLGNSSGKKHRHRRDIMLSEGVIRYLRKHHGTFIAALAWLILVGFNASRVLLWSLLALLTQKPAAKDRRNHFLAVCKGFGAAWPRSLATAQPVHTPAPAVKPT